MVMSVESRGAQAHTSRRAVVNPRGRPIPCQVTGAKRYWSDAQQNLPYLPWQFLQLACHMLEHGLSRKSRSNGLPILSIRWPRYAEIAIQAICTLSADFRFSFPSQISSKARSNHQVLATKSLPASVNFMKRRPHTSRKPDRASSHHEGWNVRFWTQVWRIQTWWGRIPNSPCINY